MAVTGDPAIARRRSARGRAIGAALALVVVLVLVGCGESGLVIQPIIDSPFEDADAAVPMLAVISLTVVDPSDGSVLVSHNFRRGEVLEVPGVPFGDDLVIHMKGYVAQDPVEEDPDAYGQTCPFPVAPDGAVLQPHLFFSRVVKFAKLDIRPATRDSGLAIPYQRRALLAGGHDAAGAVTAIERFDPSSGVFDVLDPRLSERDHAVQALFGIPPLRALVIGGSTDQGGVKNIDVYDGEQTTQIVTADMGRIDLTATTLTNGEVVVIGGRPPGGVPIGDIDEISEADSMLHVSKLNARLEHPRSGHTATRLGDNDLGAAVLIAGGLGGVKDMNAPVALAELFKPLSKDLADPLVFKPEMRFPRYGHTAVRMPDGTVLFIGGRNLTAPIRELERFTIDGGFVHNANDVLPQDAGVVDFAITTLPDGRILLTGGRDGPGSPPLASAYIIRLNPLDGTLDIVPTDPMAFARAGHQALRLCDGTVLITGGAPQGFVAERYNPPPLGRQRLLDQR